MARPKLTLAVSHYDRYVPLMDGSVAPKGFDLTVLHVGQSEDVTKSAVHHAIAEAAWVTGMLYSVDGGVGNAPRR